VDLEPMVGAGEQVDGGLVVEPDDADDEEGQQIGQDLAGRSSRSLPVACTRMPTILVAAMVGRATSLGGGGGDPGLAVEPASGADPETGSGLHGCRPYWSEEALGSLVGALLSLVCVATSP